MSELHVDDPRGWLASTPLLDLDDPKLRLKARALTQLCKSEREKALALYGFAKRLDLFKPMNPTYRTAREVMDAGGGDANDKATVLIAMLRASGIPARLRYIEVKGDMLQGLVPYMARAARPVAEVWLGRWVRTDTFIFDSAYLAAARQRLRDSGREWGYGIHVGAHSLWNGTNDAFLGGRAPEDDPMVLRELCLAHDPKDFTRSQAWKADYRGLARKLHWSVAAPMMGKVIRELRNEARVGIPLPVRR